ncbi:hypothetical protein ACEWPM_013580 [Roseovarius sp. S4756]|uniref:hypothetical protein n=1 Tax=Roseovarius maritimus TaxID=3342637 RepID=UPI003728E2A4
MDISKEIYPGGYYGLLKTHEKKKLPFFNVEKVLPPADVDLAALAEEIVIAPTQQPEAFERGDMRARHALLQAEFAGQSRLLLLHALLIAIQRKANPPEAAIALFQRLWAECGPRLAKDLTVRWKISAATTFADHGTTFEQRSLGMGLSILFDMVKLHDSERRLSGQPGRRPFKPDRGAPRYPLAFGMEPYSLKRGDLDRTMLARLWALSEADPVIAPLARSMLTLVMSDARSIFARVQRLKPAKAQDDEDAMLGAILRGDAP